MTYTFIGAARGKIVFAKNGCRKCYGTGRIGFLKGQTVPCGCVKLKDVQPVKKRSRWDKVKTWFKLLFMARKEA
jgi:hypothetical protein